VLANETPGVTLDFAPSLPSTPAGPRPPPAAPDKPSPPPEPSPSRWGTRELVLLGGAALTLAGAGVGVYGLWKTQSYDDEIRGLVRDIDAFALENGHDPDSVCAGAVRDRPGECAELRDVEWRRDQTETLSTVAFVSAGAFGVATALGWWFWPRARSRSGSGLGSARLPSIVPWTTRSSAGLSAAVPWR
jgi:hypothetical protein